MFNLEDLGSWAQVGAESGRILGNTGSQVVLVELPGMMQSAPDEGGSTKNGDVLKGISFWV